MSKVTTVRSDWSLIMILSYLILNKWKRIASKQLRVENEFKKGPFNRDCISCVISVMSGAYLQRNHICKRKCTFISDVNCVAEVLCWNKILQLFLLAKCPAGSYSPLGLHLPKQKCKLCPKGTYSYLKGSKECIVCPRQSTTDRDGSTLETDCKGKDLRYWFFYWFC